MWKIKSYNTFILDNSSYLAYLADEDNPSILPKVSAVLLNLGGSAPMLTSIKRDANQLVVTVKIKAADWRDAHKNLIGAFQNLSADTAPLIVVDHLGAEWIVQAKPLDALRDTGTHTQTVKIHLLVPDSLWRKAATTVDWNITSSPATQRITPSGNMKTYPVFTWKATASKGQGFFYRSWVPIYNPSTSLAMKDWALELSDGGVATTGWVADNTNKCQVNNGAGIDASQTTIPYDTVTGALPSAGMGYCGTEQISWTGKTGTTSGNLTGCTRGVGGTTPATHADNAEIKLSVMQVTGYDVRFFLDGLEQDFWFRSPNSAASRLWAVVSLSPGIALTIKNAISNVGSVTEIEFENTMANNRMMLTLPTSGTYLHDDEAFTYWGKDVVAHKIFITARAAKDTTAASHTAGTTGYWIEHEAWLYSGNPTLTARVNSDIKKPMLDMDTSDNDTRAYTEFWEPTGLRAGSFKPLVISSSNRDMNASRYYTGNHQDETANPATEMGMRMMSVYKSSRWQYENGHVAWTLYEPAGLAEITSWIYEKYRFGLLWPATVALQRSQTGIGYANISAIATPASSGSWGSPITEGPFASLGSGVYFLRVDFAGTINGGSSGGVGYEADLEVNSLTYKTVSPPVVRIMTRHSSMYESDFTIYNAATEQYFGLKCTAALGDEIEIDCAAQTVKNLADGSLMRSALHVPDNQVDWMSFLTGNNDLTYTEAGAAGVLVSVDYDDLLAV